MRKDRWKKVKMDGHRYRYRNENPYYGPSETKYWVEDVATGHGFWHDKKDIDLIVALRTIRRLCWFMIIGGGIGIVLRFLEYCGVV